MRTTTISKNFHNKPTVRVVSTTTIGFVDPQVSETVVWTGSSTDQLSRDFPPSEIWGADPLGHKEIEDGWIRTDFRFERQLMDGTWDKIDDPRRRLTPITSYERAIDEENRRLFPGDYITDDDCERCGGYGCEECESYQEEYYCDNCRDAGCKECTYNCESCQDYGCERCEPQAEA